MAQDTPLLAINTWKTFVETAPLAATKLSPKAAITSMSPGLTLFTLVGLVLDLELLVGHGNGTNSGISSWSFWKKNIFPKWNFIPPLVYKKKSTIRIIMIMNAFDDNDEGKNITRKMRWGKKRKWLKYKKGKDWQRSFISLRLVNTGKTFHFLTDHEKKKKFQRYLRSFDALILTISANAQSFRWCYKLTGGLTMLFLNACFSYPRVSIHPRIISIHHRPLHSCVGKRANVNPRPNASTIFVL